MNRSSGLWPLMVGVAIVGLLFALLSARPSPTHSHRPVLGIAPGGGVFGLPQERLEADSRAMAELGVSWVRLDIDWSQIETQPGVFDWRATDRVMATWEASGHSVLGLIGYTPRWARPTGTSDKTPPTDPGDYARFVAVAAQRYGDRVEAWELWNEPNLRRFWEPGPNPDDYAVLVQAASASLRAEAPNATIVLGGLAPAVDDPPNELSPERFLAAVIDDLDRGDIDAVALHPYSYPGRPGGGQSWNLFSRIRGIRNQLQQATGEAIPIWLTEYGAPTGTSAQAVSEAEQAAMVSEAVACVAHWSFVEALFVFTSSDTIGGNPAESEENFGLLRADGSPKPAANALAEALDGPFTYSVSPCD